MFKSESNKKNNVIDMFSKSAAVEQNRNVDYTLLNQFNNKNNNKVVKLAKRDNLVVLFPSFCA